MRKQLIETLARSTDKHACDASGFTPPRVIRVGRDETAITVGAYGVATLWEPPAHEHEQEQEQQQEQQEQRARGIKPS